MCARLLRAKLDGGWCRVHHGHDEQLAAAIDRVNAGLPERHWLGFTDTLTGATYGAVRTVAEVHLPAARD